MPRIYKAIIADDEEPLRNRLVIELHRAWPELRICGEAENGVQALDRITMLEPEIAFLDIKMPGLTGLQVAQRAPAACRIVFITAYDQYAVEAFERQAVDYLLKPVDPPRLSQTVERLKAHLDRPVEANDKLASLLQSLQERLAAVTPPAYLQWIKAADSRGLRLIPAEEIRCFQARDKYTAVHTRDGEFLIRKPIRELAGELDPSVFWQIHRGTIVNAAAIDKISSSLTGRYVLTLKEMDGALTVSRGFHHRFKAM
ncbi:MAG: LytTR family DNA-binding domain-containing protein [Pseudomonadota bacterium]